MACEAQKKGINYVFTFITKVLSGGDTASCSHDVHPPRPPPPSYSISMSSWTQRYSDKRPSATTPHGHGKGLSPTQQGEAPRKSSGDKSTRRPFSPSIILLSGTRTRWLEP